MEFKELVAKSREISRLYEQLNEEQGNTKKWEFRDYVLGFMEDLGTLSRLVMMKSDIRAKADDLDEKLKHEVCDCLMSTIRIADALGVDLETEFPIQMDKLAKRIKEEKH
ncbi:MAG TPA: nucleotide pyrophosphohydrolase [Candidatus Paceibacterota bacterium]|nr:nucleotide pyrophosphohydrolase [Candidatus Paceibacterota bacterium]